MKTFKDLQDYAIKIAEIDDDDLYDRKITSLGQKAENFISTKYPEIYEYMDGCDGDDIMDCLDVSDSEEDFIKELINYYYIDPIDLLEFDKEELIDNYIKSKLYADSESN